MACQKCGSERIAGVSGKTSDRCDFSIDSKDIHHDGYVPHDVGLGGGDYIEFDYCLDCGQMQGEWPLPLCELETDGSGEDDEDEEKGSSRFFHND